MSEIERLRSLLRETVFRCQIAFPENEQDLKWFDETASVVNCGDFHERIHKELDLGNLDID